MMEATFTQAAFRAGLTLLCTIFLIFAMTDFRYSRKQCLLIILSYFCAATLINAILIYFGGREILIRYFLLTTTLPCVLMLSVLAKDDIFKAQFNFWTQINLFFAIVILSYYITLFFNGDYYTEMALRVAFYGLILYVYIRFLRKPFRLFAEVLETGWGMISFIPILFSLIIISLGLYPSLFNQRPEVLPTLALVYLTMFGVYVVIFFTFRRSYDLLNSRKEAELLSLQVRLQKRQFDTQQQKIEVIRMYRHDMRHHISVITAFLQDRQVEKAEAYAKRIQTLIDEAAYYQFCENYLVNTLVSLYTELASTQDITISSELHIPEELFVEDTDLCVIFSNALENALNACAQLPAAQNSSINVICRYYPKKLVVEIRNPYAGSIQFDTEGFPISQAPERGIGTQSIAFIAQKYNGLVHYNTEGNWFILQIMLNDIGQPPPTI